MNRKVSKRRQIVMRSFIYALMTISVLTIVTVLILIILGYSFNRQDGRLEQGGLLQFSSTPSGATVTIDGLPTGSRTPSKANVEARSHHVQMDLAGYRSWKKSITVEPGGIGWLSYARFVPTDIKTENMRTFPKLAGSIASIDRKWIMAQEDAAANAFTLINIESDTPKFTEVVIPSTVVTAPTNDTPQSFTLVAWSRNSDRLLVKHTYDTDKTEWIVLDRQNLDRSINVTTTYGLAISDVQFGEPNGSNAYILSTDGVVRKADFGNRTLSGVLVENVSEYSVYDKNTVLYVTRPDGKDMNQRHAGYREDGMSAPQTVFSYPAETENIHLAFGSYYGKRYVAVTHGTILQVFVGSLPRGTTKADLDQLERTTLPNAPTRLTIGENGRLVVAEMGDGYTTYDIELDKTDTTTFNKPATVARPLQWLDSYVIANDRGSMLRFYEFDGGNQQDVMPVIEGQAMSLTGNEKFLYGFTAEDDVTALTRARMTVNR